MVLYSEQFPKCAECPKLAEWQESTDRMARDFERASIGDCLQRVERDHQAEANRQDLDRRYANFLDGVEAGAVSDKLRIAEADILYSKLDSVAENTAANDSSQVAFANKAAAFLMRITENEVELLASSCRGPRKLSLFGRTAILCRSRMKRLTITPPPPFFKDGAGE